MARRVLFRSNIFLLALFFIGCKHSLSHVTIPDVVIKTDAEGLMQHEGYLYYQGKKFSGRMLELYPNGDTALIIPYWNGKEEGWCYKWYEGKRLMEKRFYSGGRKEGVHKAWWPDGKPKFEYHFINDEHNGEAKEWYSNGKLYRLFHYQNGHEEGQQQMWWEDGRLRANYVVKDGEQFGLIGRKLCKNDLNEN